VTSVAVVQMAVQSSMDAEVGSLACLKVVVEA
jgi:hypothetical protein